MFTRRRFPVVSAADAPATATVKPRILTMAETTRAADRMARLLQPHTSSSSNILRHGTIMRTLFALLLIPVAALSGCDTERDATNGETAETREAADRPATISDPATGATTTPGEGGSGSDLHAVAEIRPTSGNQTRGSIRLSGGNGAVQITGTITGLKPGAHGLHIHEFGDCSAPDASSAGSHFNPHDDPHGSPRDLENAHHVGDLGNVTANQQGEAEIDIEDNEMQLSGPESVIGKALVVHAAQDDFKSQPSGNSGARVGCGEIVEEQANTGM
jgi:Cu-Zn family superoxide dismutase